MWTEQQKADFASEFSMEPECMIIEAIGRIYQEEIIKDHARRVARDAFALRKMKKTYHAYRKREKRIRRFKHERSEN